MEPSSAPPYYHHRYSSRTNKSSSRLARIGENGRITSEPLRISLDVVPSQVTTLKPPSPPRPPSSSPSALSLLRSPTKTSNSNSYCLSMRELLLLSPSPVRRSKPRFDSAVAAEEFLEPAAGLRRRCKSRGTLASPRNSRRSNRRRSEVEIREEKDVVVLGDEAGKQRKRRHSGRSKKERLSLVPFQPPSTPSPKAEEENGGELDRVGQLMTDLVMWRDVSKSTLWFGFGSLCFLSSCFTKGLNFSIFSAISQLAILLLCVSFFSKSVCQRNQVEKRVYAKLKEDDILHLAKLILPTLNFAISKTRDLFSGEPSMTLKVAPFFLLGAEYGHLITIWRLCAIGFFISFSVPKLYSSYSTQIGLRAECLKLRLFDTWSACTHKKIVLASALITFWNLSTVKTRLLTAFILLVIFRYFRQNAVHQLEDEEVQVGEKEEQQALVATVPEEKEELQVDAKALVISEH